MRNSAKKRGDAAGNGSKKIGNHHRRQYMMWRW